MIGIPPLPTDDRPWLRRTADAIAHPLRWARDVTGGAPLYPLAILFGLNAVDELDRTAFGVLLPNIQEEFGLDFAGILGVLAVVAGFSMLLQIPIAHFADRGNRVALALGGALAWSFFSVGTGLAVALWMLYVARIGSSLGRAVADPTHNSLLADWYPVEQRPRVYSVHRAANAVGQFLGPLLGGLLATWFSWRAPFVFFAVPAVLLVVAGLRMRNPVRGAQERKLMDVADEVVATEEPPPSLTEAWRMVNKVKTLRRIYSSLPFLAPALFGFVALTSLKYESLGLDELERGVAASIAEPFALVGLLIGARVGTRLLQKDPGLVLKLIAGAAVVASAFAAVLALAPNAAVAVTANVGISMALAIVGPGVLAALSLALPPRARAVGFSIGALWAIPGVLLLPVVGSLADAFGVSIGMLLFTPAFLIGGLVISSAHSLVASDIRNVWQSAAARSELLYERRAGRSQLLLVRELDVRYGDVRVLFDVSMDVEEGSIVALLGTNGAGKSTLLRAISGVVEADGGAVILDGRDITHAPPNEIAMMGVGQVPGGQGVFGGLTVEENLRAAGWQGRRRPREAAARVAEVLEQFPILADRLDDPAADLSGGQQQQLALAMAFLSRPRLLLVDELSLGLAPVIVEQLTGILRRINEQGTTVILVEQSVNVALTMADTAYFMEKGEIRFHGPTSELLERPDVLRSVFLQGAEAGLGGTAGDGASGGDERLAAPTAATERAGVPSGTAPGDGPPALEVRDLWVRFGGIRAVDDVSLAVAPGEVVGLVGPNGAGKTTLFDLVSGFTPAGGGRVLLDGRDLTSRGPSARADAGLGRSFQDARLFPSMTVEETVATALHRWVDVRDPFNAALRLPAHQDSEVAVGWYAELLIDLLGLGAFRSKLVGELSTGSRRVVDLACVLALRPSVVLLDEPSSGIAQREAEALAPLILRIRDTLGASVLVIEHDMPLVSAVSDRLVALDQGRVVTVGPADQVLAHPEVVASYLGTTDEIIARSGPSTIADPSPGGAP